MYKKELTIVIPLRKGSQRVKNKNTRLFCGHSLFYYKSLVIRELGFRVIVDSDDDYVLSEAERFGFEARKRPDYFASNQCTNSEYHEYLGRNCDTEHILIAQVTNPLIRLSTFQSAIEKYFQEDLLGVMSVQRLKTFLWNEEGPVNYSLNAAVNSQDLPPYWSPTFGVVIAPSSSIAIQRNLFVENAFFLELDEYEAIDIDTPFDFWLAEKALEFKNVEEWLLS